MNISGVNLLLRYWRAGGAGETEECNGDVGGKGMCVRKRGHSDGGL